MTLEDVRELVADRMDEISTYFKPGVKVTVIVRCPGFPSRDFMMTADEIPELEALLKRRHALRHRVRLCAAGEKT
jgi:hypothetical protein